MTILTFYKVMVIPCGLCGSHSWIVNTRIYSRIQAAEKRFIKRRDRLGNTAIRDSLGIYYLIKVMKSTDKDGRILIKSGRWMPAKTNINIQTQRKTKYWHTKKEDGLPVSRNRPNWLMAVEDDKTKCDYTDINCSKK